MKRMFYIEVLVGLFMTAAFVGLFVLAFKVSGFSSYHQSNSYEVKAIFDNIGDLKVRAPVRIAGVTIGEVVSIELNSTTYRAVVELRLKNGEKIPTDSSASILTEGLLGSNYISVTPGFEDIYLKENSTIEITHPAIILEQMIGQLLFNSSKDKKE